MVGRLFFAERTKTDKLRWGSKLGPFRFRAPNVDEENRVFWLGRSELER